eukprot:Em0010g136a
MQAQPEPSEWPTMTRLYSGALWKMLSKMPSPSSLSRIHMAVCSIPLCTAKPGLSGNSIGFDNTRWCHHFPSSLYHTSQPQ